jgi:hypothetical protein
VVQQISRDRQPTNCVNCEGMTVEPAEMHAIRKMVTLCDLGAESSLVPQYEH